MSFSRAVRIAVLTTLVLCAGNAFGLEKADPPYKIFQFPANIIPKIDGNTDDWAMVPDAYIVGTDQLGTDSATQPRRPPDPQSIDVKMKVGWVKGLNRLYFLYEAYDDYWDFSRPDLNQDILEIAVDGDASGGPFIDRFAPATQPALTPRQAWFDFHGHHAQNYHIFTPAVDKDWCMAWGPQASWIKKLPYSNIAYNYNFKPGEAGKLIMEFWITPFDEAPAEGPEHAIESKLMENKIIGLCWAVLDYDNVSTTAHGFWNLSPKHTMYGQASELCAFKLMPLETKVAKKIEADWSFMIRSLDERIVAFKDESVGNITKWSWDFGDGTTSDEKNPQHIYARAGQYVVILTIEGPDGQSRRAKVWDVTLR